MTRVHVFIDETGDRGRAGKSSPIFGMAAVITPEDRLGELQQAVAQLRQDFHVPQGTVLSWKKHVKTHDRRKHAVAVLSALPNVTVCYVYAQKSELQKGTYADDPELFYNYLAYKMMKSCLWAAKHSLGASKVLVRFGHVRHHDHTTTERYIRREMRLDPTVPSQILEALHWVSADKYSESQAADLYGGFLKAATWPSGEFSTTEESYLLKVWGQVRNSSGCVIPLGIMSMPTYEVLTSAPWFPCVGCKRSKP